jgi:hypothetical protein
LSRNFLEALGKIKAVAIWQSEIEEHQVEIFFAQSLLSLLGSIHPLDGIALFFEAFAKRLG